MKSVRMICVVMMTVMALTSCLSHKHQGSTLQANCDAATIQAFDRLELFNGIEVVLTPSNTISCTVSAQEAAQSALKMHQSNGTLTIWADGLSMSDKIVVNLSAPMPGSMSVYNSSKVNCSGDVEMNKLTVETWNSGTVSINGELKIKKLNVEAYNSAHITMGDVHAEAIDVSAFNSAYVQLSGVTDKLTRSSFNGGRIDTQRLTVLRKKSESHRSED